MYSFEIFQEPEREPGLPWRWRLIAHKAVVVIESLENFARYADARDNAESVKKAIARAKIVRI